MDIPLEASRADAAEVDEIPSLLALDEKALSHVNRGSGLEPFRRKGRPRDMDMASLSSFRSAASASKEIQYDVILTPCAGCKEEERPPGHPVSIIAPWMLSSVSQWRCCESRCHLINSIDEFIYTSFLLVSSYLTQCLALCFQVHMPG